MTARAMLLLALLASGGCQDGPAIPGPVGALESLKALQQQGRFADIAAAGLPADCAAPPFGSEACPQIHAIRGRAFLGLAMAERNPAAACPLPTPTARGNMDRAVASYRLAGGAAAPRSGDAATLAENEARAALCAAPFAAPADAEAMVRAALAALDAEPPTAGRGLVGASAALAMAQRDDAPAAQRCAAARDAAARADRGLGQAPSADLQRQLTGARNAAAQAAARLPGCTGIRT